MTEMNSIANKKQFKLIVAGIVLTAAIFALDLSIPLGVAAGVPYAAVVLIGLLAKGRRYVYIAAITGTILTLIGFFESPDGGELWKVLFNRGLAIFAIWSTAILAIWNKRDDESLRKSEQQRDAIVRSVGEGIISIGADSTIQFANQEFCGIFGFTIKELIGQNLKIVMPEKYRQSHTERLKNYLNGAPPKIIGKRIEIEGLRKSGKVFPIELRIEETIDKSGERFFTASIRDITRRKKAEKELNKYASEMESLAEERSKQLAQVDKMNTLGTLSAGIAHEINNPVGFISNNLQIFERLWDRNLKACIEKVTEENKDKKLTFALDEMPRMVKEMREGTKRISTIVNKLREFSCFKEEASEQASICECIKSAINFCGFDNTLKYKVDIQLNLPEGIPDIMMRRHEIEQVFINIFINASHAMKETGDEKKPTLKVSAEYAEDEIVIEIADNGNGMNEETLEQIFNPFYTTKDTGKGTGLGLSICYGIIRNHRGTIKAASTSGEETTFTITLPVEPQKK